MRVWIVWSWYEVALIASWLPGDVTVDCYIDRAMRPWTSKSFDDISSRIQKWVTHLEGIGVDSIIVPPFAEELMWSTSDIILPLFSSYMHTYVFAESRIGKLWVCSMHGASWERKVKEIIANLQHAYERTTYQKNTSTFKSNFPCWIKDCAHRQTHLLYATKRSWMMRNLIKDDIRYFKNCAVDTLVPMDRGILYREKMINHRLWARMRFHGQQAVRSVLAWLLSSDKIKNDKPSVCRLRTTAYPEDILENRKRKQLLDRGGKRMIEIEQIR